MCASTWSNRIQQTNSAKKNGMSRSEKLRCFHRSIQSHARAKNGEIFQSRIIASHNFLSWFAFVALLWLVLNFRLCRLSSLTKSNRIESIEMKLKISLNSISRWDAIDVIEIPSIVKRLVAWDTSIELHLTRIQSYQSAAIDQQSTETRKIIALCSWVMT